MNWFMIFQCSLRFLQELGYGRSQKICIVTDSNVAPLYARDVQDLLEKEFDTVILHTFEAGEHNKNLETVNCLYQTLIEQHFDRQDLLVALGGGVCRRSYRFCGGDLPARH